MHMIDVYRVVKFLSLHSFSCYILEFESSFKELTAVAVLAR